MLRQRFITSLILIPIILLMIFYASPRTLFAILCFVGLFLAKESWQLIPLVRLWQKLGFVLLLAFSTWVCYTVFSAYLFLGLVLWLGILVAIIGYPKSQVYWGEPVIVAAVLLLVLSLFLQTSMKIYALHQGKSLILFLFFLVWAADIGAYCAGKCFGKSPLIPKVSPKKSWEGVAGGLILAFLVAYGGFIYFSSGSLWHWFLWAFLTVVASIVGDLFISILKRRCHLKDTGTIIYGHGGLLDRLDSLIAASPIFYLGFS